MGLACALWAVATHRQHTYTSTQCNTNTQNRERDHTRDRDAEKMSTSWCQAVVERRKAGKSHMQNRDAWRCSARLITQADAAPQRSRETGRKKRDTAWMPGHVLVPASRYAHWPEVSWTLETTAVATWLQGASQCAAVGREGATHLIDQLERDPPCKDARRSPTSDQRNWPEERKCTPVFAKSESKQQNQEIREVRHKSRRIITRVIKSHDEGGGGLTCSISSTSASTMRCDHGQ